MSFDLIFVNKIIIIHYAFYTLLFLNAVLFVLYSLCVSFSLSVHVCYQLFISLSVSRT